MAPSFYVEVQYDTSAEGEALILEIDSLHKKLHAEAYGNFKIVADAAKVEKIKNDLKGFRFYKTPLGEYPSVTTIIEPEFKSYVTEQQLEMAIAEGNIQDARAKHFIQTGEWLDTWDSLKRLEGVASDLLLCSRTITEAWDFPAMLKKYPIKDLKVGRVLISDGHRYAGTNDAECLYPLGGEKDGEPVPTIIDFKRTPDEKKNYIQTAAYAKCPGMEHIRQAMLISVNPDNQQRFSKPLVNVNIPMWFEVFLERRKTFEATYGV